MNNNGTLLLCGVEFNYERYENKIMFRSESGIEFEIEFELSNRTGRLYLDYIERYDQNSDDFFNDNWEEIFESVEQHF